MVVKRWIPKNSATSFRYRNTFSRKSKSVLHNCINFLHSIYYYHHLLSYRPVGRIDRKIEFPLPDQKTKRRIFNIHTSRMTLSDDVNLSEYIMAKDDLSGADIKVSNLLISIQHRRQLSRITFERSLARCVQVWYFHVSPCAQIKS
jgi:hypothetical protein